jgi:hypothetical protein
MGVLQEDYGTSRGIWNSRGPLAWLYLAVMATGATEPDPMLDLYPWHVASGKSAIVDTAPLYEQMMKQQGELDTSSSHPFRSPRVTAGHIFAPKEDSLAAGTVPDDFVSLAHPPASATHTATACGHLSHTSSSHFTPVCTAGIRGGA